MAPSVLGTGGAFFLRAGRGATVDGRGTARGVDIDVHDLGLGDLAPLVSWVSARHAVGDDDESGIGWALLEAVDDLEGVAGLANWTGGTGMSADVNDDTAADEFDTELITPVITTASLPDAHVATEYFQQLQAQGGTPPNSPCLAMAWS